MNGKFIASSLVVFIIWMAGSLVVHGTLLHDDYAQLANLFRSDEDSTQYFPLMILAHVIVAVAFVWIYRRGMEAKPWLAQGLRYSFAIALLTVVPTYIIYYVVQPLPGALVVKQIVFDGILLLVLGAVVAFLYRGQQRSRGRELPGVADSRVCGHFAGNQARHLATWTSRPARSRECGLG